MARMPEGFLVEIDKDGNPRDRSRPSNLFGNDADEVEGIPSLVSYFQRPILTRSKFAIDVLEYFTGHDGRLLPGGLMVGEFLADPVGAGTFTVDVEKIPRHAIKIRLGK
jgi:hypothetical protein